MLGITGGNPSFGDDDGSADVAVVTALAAFAAGQGSETAALAALARSRLLVPVVAVLTEQLSDQDNGPGGPAPAAGPGGARPGGARSSGHTPAKHAGRSEKASEMAMPTLIGLDGRRAVPAFTCLEAMRGWQAGARPVPVSALHVWQAAVADACAVVIDVAGPVPLAVEGARLAALARGEPPPQPCSDPDVREIVADVLAGQLDVAGFELRPGDADQDLTIALTMAPQSAGRDVTAIAEDTAGAVLARLGGRLRRGIAIWLSGTARRS